VYKLKSDIYIVSLVLLVLALIPAVACNAGASGQTMYAPRIISLAAEHKAIYPLGNTKINCLAEDPDGDALNYTWTCDDGQIIGSGSQITWEAPKAYGDFHIMANVDDGKGNSGSKIVTVTVLVRDSSTCCR
jgi:hypothetical protein